jgi:DNA-binding MltR family transcriptional regulator
LKYYLGRSGFSNFNIANQCTLNGWPKVKTALDRYIDSLQNESDRGCVVIGADFLSNALELRLSGIMKGNESLKRELLKGTGPISGFSSKIKIAYTFNFIREEAFHDLNIIRQLRNKVAHSFNSFSLDNPDVKGLLAPLKMVDLGYKKMEQGTLGLDDTDQYWVDLFQNLGRETFVSSGRARYNYTVAMISGYLNHTHDKNTGQGDKRSR